LSFPQVMTPWSQLVLGAAPMVQRAVTEAADWSPGPRKPDSVSVGEPAARTLAWGAGLSSR
jgi:hypothetical protein